MLIKVKSSNRYMCFNSDAIASMVDDGKGNTVVYLTNNNSFTISQPMNNIIELFEKAGIVFLLTPWSLA
jgi:hypothetical protein